MPTHPLALVTARSRRSADHDLQNLLFVVSTFAQLLHDGQFGPVTPSQQEHLRHIVDSAAQAQQVTRRVVPMRPAA